MTDKKYFPIQTATSCQLKWAWSTIMLQTGGTSSCHRVQGEYFDIDTFNFHNTSQKLNHRKTMLDGEWPTVIDDLPLANFSTTCAAYCGTIEKTGIGQSDRQFFSKIPNLTPVELATDPTAIIVSPTILEVYLDNTCNLSCVYCGPELSSRIDVELKKYGRFEKNGLILESAYIKHANYEKIEQKFWEWLKNNGTKLQRLHLLGGEPFYQRQFDDFLTFFENNPCPSLEFNIVTNLMLSTDKLIRYIERIKLLIKYKKIKRLDITASIDCWGPQQEFVRHGLELNRWQKNFEYLIEQRWIKLNINNTVSILTIKTLPDLLVKLDEWTKDRKIEQYFSQLYHPTYLAPAILGADEFREDFINILNLMETTTWRGSHAKTYMEGIISTSANATVDLVETLKLLTYLDELDRRRNTNWRELFPWLIKYEVLCGITK